MAMVGIQVSTVLNKHLNNFQRCNDIAQITQPFRENQILFRRQKYTKACLKTHSSFGEAILSFILLYQDLSVKTRE